MLIAALLITSQTVSFSCPPSNFADLRPRLESALATSIEIDPALRNEVVVIEVSDVSTEDLKTKIADVVCGKWETVRPGRIRLVVDREEEDRRFQKSLERAAKNVEKNVAEYATSRKRFATPAPTPEEVGSQILQLGQVRSGLYQALPAYGLQADLLSLMDPKQIAIDLYSGGGFYSTNDPLASRTPDGTKKLVRSRLQELSDIGEYLFARGFQPSTGSGNVTSGIEKFRFPKVDGVDGRLYLDFSDLKMGEGTFILIDGSGIGVDELSFGFYDGTWIEANIANITLPEPEVDVFNNQSDLKKTFDSGRVVLPNLKGDPLSWYYPDGSWRKVARESDRDLVVSLPDSIIHSIQWSLEKMLPWHGIEIEDGNGWIIGRQMWCSRIRKERADRRAVDRILNRLRQGRIPALQEWTENELKILEGGVLNDPRYLCPLFAYAAVDSATEAYSIIPRFADWSSTLRTLALQGGGIEFLSLSRADQRLFSSLVLYSHSPYDQARLPFGSRLGDGVSLHFSSEEPERCHLHAVETTGDDGAKHYSLEEEPPDAPAKSRIVADWTRHSLKLSIRKDGRTIHENLIQSHEVQFNPQGLNKT